MAGNTHTHIFPANSENRFVFSGKFKSNTVVPGHFIEKNRSIYFHDQMDSLGHIIISNGEVDT